MRRRVPATAGRQEPGRLTAPPFGSGRLGLRLTPSADGRAALAIYRPLTRKGRALRAAIRAVSRVPALPATDEEMVGWLGDMTGIRIGGAAVMDSSTPGRVIIGLANAGRLVAVAKVGAGNDAGLRNETGWLRSAPVRAPDLLAAGELPDGRYVVATVAVAGRARTDPAAVLPTAIALAAAGVVHGDFAPWNVVGDPATVLDWEAASDHFAPLHDLTHFVVRAAAHLGPGDPATVVGYLIGAGGAGAAYAAATGLNRRDLPAHVAGYLARTEDAPHTPAESALRAGMIGAM